MLTQNLRQKNSLHYASTASSNNEFRRLLPRKALGGSNSFVDKQSLINKFLLATMFGQKLCQQLDARGKCLQHNLAGIRVPFIYILRDRNHVSQAVSARLIPQLRKVEQNCFESKC
jgi:hypothetical protein